MVPLKNKYIVDTTNMELELCPSKPFNNYQVAFLKTAMQLNLNFPVSIRKAYYRYKIEMINAHDVDMINIILKKMSSTCSLNDNFIYVNGSNALYINEDKVIIPFMADKMWMVNLTLLGMKTKENGVASPVFTLDGASMIR